MKRFKNILLVFDPEVSERSMFRRGAALAKNNKGRLTVVSVIRHLPRDIDMANANITSQEFQERAIKERRTHAERFVKLVKQDVSDVNFKVVIGRPFIEIIRLVIRDKHDLVMVTAERKTGLKNSLFGSTSLHLMRKCPCPVWVMKPTRRKRYTRILAAVDPSSINEERNVLNRVIMDLATSMATIEESVLHVVHAWSLVGEGHMRAFGDAQPKDIDRWRGSARCNAHNQLDDLVKHYSLETLDHEIHLLEGDPDSLITELAKKKRIDLIVMGTVCRTGIAGFFIGNTAENVLQKVNCSVLTVKPENFVSPVEV